MKAVQGNSSGLKKSSKYRNECRTLQTKSHAFNTGIAIDFDVPIAIWLNYLSHWAEKNLAEKRHIYDGLVWSYNSLEGLQDIFPYFSRRQIERIINNSVDAGLVIRGNYNTKKYDRTCWYALTPKAYFYFDYLLTKKYVELLVGAISPNGEMDFTKRGNGFHQTVTPIPITDPHTEQNTISSSCEEQKNDSVESRAIADESQTAKIDSENNAQTIPPILADEKKVESASKKVNTYYEYPETYYDKKSSSKSKTQKHTLSVNDMVNDNPHNLPQEVIEEWQVVRKQKRSPITPTAWRILNKTLYECVNSGFTALHAFETMVANGWQSLKVEYLIAKNASQSKQHVVCNTTEKSYRTNPYNFGV